MNPEVKGLWLTALRSGDYIQGQGRLHKVVGGQAQFCCLGVLCEIAVGQGVIPSARAFRFDDGNSEFEYGNSYVYLPPEVEEWACVDQEGRVDTDLSLTSMNDSGYNFDAIANVIEENL